MNILHVGFRVALPIGVNLVGACPSHIVGRGPCAPPCIRKGNNGRAQGPAPTLKLGSLVVLNCGKP